MRCISRVSGSDKRHLNHKVTKDTKISPEILVLFSALGGESVVSPQNASKPEVVCQFEHEDPVARGEVRGVELILDFIVDKVEVASRAILPAEEEVR